MDEFLRLRTRCRDGLPDRPGARPRWRDGGGSEAAQLVVSELVTNAVVHASTLIDLTLRLVPRPGGWVLHVGVRDFVDGEVSLPPAAPQSADRGRGLMVVAAVAEAWGVLVPQSGKVVWATIDV